MAYKDKEKQREFQKAWRTKRRLAYFEGKSCVVCGSTESLELDHIDPSQKKYNPAAIWGMSDDNPNKIAELAKCQVLCLVHHKEKTKQWHESNRSHGRSWYAYGCRCDVCKEAQRLHNAQRYS
jgi:hypothetical protein